MTNAISWAAVSSKPEADRESLHDQHRLNLALAEALLFTLALLIPAACAARPRPPAPRFTSFDSFIEALETTAGSGSRRETDSFWRSLVDTGQVSFRLGDRVAFLYRGRARSVAWVGDFTQWQTGPPLPGKRLLPSNIWVSYDAFPSDARLEYRIVVGGREPILDPANPLKQWGGFGANSVLAMPDYEFPAEIVPRKGVTPGNLSSWIIIDSLNLGYEIRHRVYTPAGYDALTGLPTIYVTDGHEYTDPRMGSMPTILDNLIADGSVEPLIAVFIDPTDPTSGQNRRESQLLANPDYAAYIAEELVPSVDGAYRTDVSALRRAILGVSYGGVNAAFCGLSLPHVFQFVAMQSPAFQDTKIYERFLSGEGRGLKVFVAAGYPWDLDVRTIGRILEEGENELMYLEVPEGHSWGQWRAQIDDLLLNFFGRNPNGH